MFERPESGERTVCVDFSAGLPFADEDLEEFKHLIISAGGELCATLTGKLRRPNPKYFIGSGQVDVLSELITEHETALVIFNHELSPTQERNLEKALKCRVLDRSGLILDIFASRAQSYEGKLQVELAQLQHLSTRLVRGWTHLERQKGGIGLRGPGETQLETDRRLLGGRIKTIKARLEKVSSQRQQNRRAREKTATPVIALVGYTNAGKSTLFNALTTSETYAADQLFATLDPCLRRIELPDLGAAIVVDTVGFIRALPHELIKAFHATLEETRQADLLLQVVDVSDQHYHRQIEQVNKVLKEIAADAVPMLLVHNKIDNRDELSPRLDRNAEQVPTRVWLSAKTKQGLEELQLAMVECCQGRLFERTIVLTPMQSDVRAQLYDLQAVLSESIDATGQIVLRLKLSERACRQLIRQYDLTPDAFKHCP